MRPDRSSIEQDLMLVLTECPLRCLSLLHTFAFRIVEQDILANVRRHGLPCALHGASLRRRHALRRVVWAPADTTRLRKLRAQHVARGRSRPGPARGARVRHAGARHGPACEAKATSPGTVPGSATCSVAGCMRVTWNGLPGEQCCRTCNSSDGARHGPDCETKANRGGFAQKSGSRNSGGARKRKHSSEAYPGAPDRSLWDSKRQEGRDAKKLFRVDAGSEEFAYVKDLFMATMHSKNVVIERIERIENGPQHEAYAQKKKAISDEIAKNLPQDTSDPKNIVRMLFHGTSQQAQRNIIHSDSSGFEPLASGTSTGAIWGEGTYFARDASYSHSFSSMKAGLRQVMLNEVVVGKMTKGRQGIKIYPKVPGTVRGSVMTFHSLVDNEKNPSIFVIKAGSQAYPAFVISYRENTAGDASRAAGGANSQSVTLQTAQKAPQQQGGEGCSIQ